MANNATANSEPLSADVLSVRIIRGLFDFFLGIPPLRYVWLAVIVAVAATALSGFYRVDLDETVAKRRFGSLVDDAIQPGLHWRFPLGIEQIDKFKTGRVHSIEVDTRIDPSVSAFTGDVHLVDAKFSIQYMVTDLSKYLFQNSDPIAVLQSRIKSVYMDVISGMFVYMVLITEKKYIEGVIAEQVRQEIELLNLGIELVSVNIVYVSPPLDAVPAFRAVNDAKSDREQVVVAAKRRVQQTLAQAVGVAANVVEQAHAKARTRIAEATSAARRFDAMLESDRFNSPQARHTHYWNTVKKYLGLARVVLIRPGEAPRLAVNLLDDSARMPALDAVRGHADHAGSAGIPGKEAPHPGSAAAHVTEDEEARTAGFGGHQETSEAHHLGPVPDESRRLPSHDLDPKVENQLHQQPSRLGLPHDDKMLKAPDKAHGEAQANSASTTFAGAESAGQAKHRSTGEGDLNAVETAKPDSSASTKSG